MQERSCKRRKRNKPILSFKLLKFTSIKNNGDIEVEERYHSWCNNCVKNYVYIPPKDKVSKGDFKRQKLTVWGLVCEDYLSDPSIPLQEIGRKYNYSYSQVSLIISKYLGDGKPIMFAIKAEDTGVTDAWPDTNTSIKEALDGVIDKNNKTAMQRLLTWCEYRQGVSSLPSRPAWNMIVTQIKEASLNEEKEQIKALFQLTDKSEEALQSIFE